MEKTVLEQALSEAESCASDRAWGFPRHVAFTLEQMFKSLLANNSQVPVQKIVRTAIVDICAIFPVEIESEDYGFDSEEVI